MSNLPVSIRIPPQDRQRFERFATTAKGAAGWCEMLPMGNPQALASTLCEALDEFNRTPLPTALRHDLLLTLQAAIQQAMTLVGHRLANQPLELPKGLQALAKLADQLAGLTCTAYSIVAVHTLDDPARVGKRDPARMTGESLQRAIHFAAHKVLLAYQLHLPLEARVWNTLHQLYLLAEQQQLATMAIPGPDGRGTTIQATYLLPLLLACCQPGQLLQADVNQVYQGLGFWARLCRLHTPRSGQGLLAVDLGASAPPTYTATLRVLDTLRHRLLDTGPLVTHVAGLIEAARQAQRNDIVLGSTRLQLPILEHVINCLGSDRIRSTQRVSVRQTLDAAPGFSASHYYLAGERTLEQLTGFAGTPVAKSPGAAENPFLRETGSIDPWSVAEGGDPFQRSAAAMNADGSIEMRVEEAAPETIAEPPPPPASLFSISPAVAVDASPGGYCLEWDCALKSSLRSGELLCLRGSEKAPWQLGVIRWVHQEHGKSVRTGVELLGGKPAPWAARLLREGSNKTTTSRVFLLSATPLTEHHATLITPRSGFTEGQLLGLERNGEQSRVRLRKQIAMTAGMRQFEVERLQ